MKTIRIFDENKPIPKYLQKHEKVHEIVMLLLTFVVMPIVSILIVTLTASSVGLRVVETTVSMLAWFNGKLPEVYVWGTLNLALYVYLLKLNLDAEQYSKAMKVLFFVATGLAITILLVGLSLPFTKEPSIFHSLHNTFAIVGFAFVAGILVVLCLTTFFRNVKQGLIINALICFFIITGVFSIPQINSPTSDSFITAGAQMYVFAMMHVILALNFFFAKFLPNKAEEVKDEEESHPCER